MGCSPDSLIVLKRWSHIVDTIARSITSSRGAIAYPIPGSSFRTKALVAVKLVSSPMAILWTSSKNSGQLFLVENTNQNLLIYENQFGDETGSKVKLG